jgi:D-tyrosyl-tRNA(Tyr) deacylase
MRAVVQRVASAAVTTRAECVAAIGQGLLVYLGVGTDDSDPDVEYIVEKVRHLRVFADERERMNRDIVEAGGQVLAVSAFTVQADARRGRRPSFDAAAPAEGARRLYEQFCDRLAGLGVNVERGSFGNHMAVESVNDGPVCILLDSKRGF